MKFWFGTPGWGWRLWGVSNGDKWFIGLSVNQGASHDSENVAEIEALRAEVAEAREFRDKLANAIGNDQLRRFIEKHGEPVPLTIRVQAAEARSERLEAEVERLRALCAAAYQMAGVHDAPVEWLDALSNAASGRKFSIDGLLPYMPDAVCNAEVRALELEREIEALRAEVTALQRELGALHMHAKQRDQYAVEKAAQALDWKKRAEQLEAEVERVTCELMDAITRADKLEEALRELVDVFSESGMYDEEVFAKARAALGQEDDQ